MRKKRKLRERAERNAATEADAVTPEGSESELSADAEGDGSVDVVAEVGREIEGQEPVEPANDEVAAEAGEANEEAPAAEEEAPAAEDEALATDEGVLAGEGEAADAEAGEVADAPAVDGAEAPFIGGDGEDEDPLEASVGGIPAGLTDPELKSLLESLIFATDKPLPMARLRQLSGEKNVARLQGLLDQLTADYKDRGIVLHFVGGAYQFRTHPRYSTWVQHLIAGRPVRLSRAQLETLAIIAYRQPITRPEIDDIRGVDSGATLKMLLDRSLVRVLGKKEEPGRPMLYGTTKEFLEFFNLNELRDLPTLREYHELSEDSLRVVKTKGFDVPSQRAEAVEAAEGAEAAESEVAEAAVAAAVEGELTEAAAVADAVEDELTEAAEQATEIEEPAAEWEEQPTEVEEPVAEVAAEEPEAAEADERPAGDVELPAIEAGAHEEVHEHDVIGEHELDEGSAGLDGDGAAELDGDGDGAADEPVPVADVLDSDTDPDPVGSGEAIEDDGDIADETPNGEPVADEVVSDVDPETGPDDFDEAI